MKLIKFLLSIVIVFFCFGSLMAQRPKYPRLPFVDKGACPFECCTYREWNVIKPTAIRTRMSDRSAVLFKAAKDEKIRGVTGVVITTRAGVVRVLKNTKVGDISVSKGETLYLLTYLGEGFYKVWRKGRIIEENMTEEGSLKVVSQPLSVWWMKVKNQRGQTGWSREPDNFGNKDKCGS